MAQESASKKMMGIYSQERQNIYEEAVIVVAAAEWSLMRQVTAGTGENTSIWLE